jgi:hypothetical protein
MLRDVAVARRPGPGWFPDPEAPADLPSAVRWWNGSGWGTDRLFWNGRRWQDGGRPRRHSFASAAAPFVGVLAGTVVDPGWHLMLGRPANVHVQLQLLTVSFGAFLGLAVFTVFQRRRQRRSDRTSARPPFWSGS